MILRVQEGVINQQEAFMLIALIAATNSIKLTEGDMGACGIAVLSFFLSGISEF